MSEIRRTAGEQHSKGAIASFTRFRTLKSHERLKVNLNQIRLSLIALSSMAPIILVPQGAEYQAVCQGLKQHPDPPKVLPIAIGVTAVHLDTLALDQTSKILVMGLCGSLTPRLGVGAVALYTACIDFAGIERNCDRALTHRLQDRFQVSPIRGLTSDRVICSAREKCDLGRTYQADVVDMEGSAVAALNGAVAMLRVVSDDTEHDLPDLDGTIDANGKLQPLPLAIALCKRPIAATRLIRGSLVGLNVLRDLAARLPI